MFETICIVISTACLCAIAYAVLVEFKIIN